MTMVESSKYRKSPVFRDGIRSRSSAAPILITRDSLLRESLIGSSFRIPKYLYICLLPVQEKELLLVLWHETVYTPLHIMPLFKYPYAQYAIFIISSFFPFFFGGGGVVVSVWASKLLSNRT